MSGETMQEVANAGWNLNYSYRNLPPIMFQSAFPEKVLNPKLVKFNTALSHEMGLRPEILSGLEGAEVFSGSRLPHGAEPLAMAYAGHQFGHFNVLGDGRAILLGEQTTPTGQIFDIQFKGSGKTPYSRRGDGKAVLGPMLREYIISEAMYALGIPTTRSLAVVTTGETIERESSLPGAVLTRVASSHIRVGTFQFAAVQGSECVKQLADYTITRHFPDLSTKQDLYLQFLVSVIDRQAKLISSWLSVGFIHGVMNTDNMSICGETIDYGPCAFMDFYKPNQVYSFIDRQSRYAYQNQPSIALWNLERFAECLLPILDKSSDKALAQAKEALATFPERFQFYWTETIAKKLGLDFQMNKHQELVMSFLDLLDKHNPDFTNTFRGLCEETPSLNSFLISDDFKHWNRIYLDERKALGIPSHILMMQMKKQNPSVIPRNHLVQKALDDAELNGDISLFEKLLKAVSSPYDGDSFHEEFSQPPLPHEEIENTFCGT